MMTNDEIIITIINEIHHDDITTRTVTYDCVCVRTYAEFYVPNSCRSDLCVRSQIGSFDTNHCYIYMYSVVCDITDSPKSIFVSNTSTKLSDRFYSVYILLWLFLLRRRRRWRWWWISCRCHILPSRCTDPKNQNRFNSKLNSFDSRRRWYEAPSTTTSSFLVSISMCCFSISLNIIIYAHDAFAGIRRKVKRASMCATPPPPPHSPNSWTYNWI